MIVVSNTSPLTSLASVGQFDLLRRLYSLVNIADGVWDELNAMGKAWPGSQEVAASGWIHRHTVRNRFLVRALRRDIDRGEAESIVLALELGADMILLDEKEGRSAARRMNLKPVGVIGVLLEAKKNGLLYSVRPHLDSLRQVAGFRIKESLYLHALELACEP
ncbi:DUF3368 domain-containing protein [Desulfococcaceae bacterium HSG8]|nr:DUF3368 domain-containing protein [Desulfococcaceae bacterium HSG8]